MATFVKVFAKKYSKLNTFGGFALQKKNFKKYKKKIMHTGRISV